MQLSISVLVKDIFILLAFCIDFPLPKISGVLKFKRSLLNFLDVTLY